MKTFQEQVPEAAGPGTERGDGAILYGGDQELPHVVIPPARTRDPDLPANVVPDYGGQCLFCDGIPVPLLAALRQALDTRGARR